MSEIFTKVAKSRKRAAGGWGGARNLSVSTVLTEKQVQRLHDAAVRAMNAGVPFNRFVTVHWGALGIVDADAAKATGRLIKLASDWCATRGVKMTWAWVRENDEGDGSKGSHVHILLHCPADLFIGRMWRRWLRRLTGRAYKPNGVFSRSVGPTLRTCANNPNLYAENLQVALNYMTKGVAPAVAAKLCIEKPVSTGAVIGKRAAWWHHRR